MRCIAGVLFVFLIFSLAPVAAQSPQYRRGGPPPTLEECPQGRQIRAQKAYPSMMTDCEVLDADTAAQNNQLRQRAVAPAAQPMRNAPRSLSQEQIRRLIDRRETESVAPAQPGMLVSDPPATGNSSPSAPIFTDDLHNLSSKTTFSEGMIFLAAGLLVYFLPALMAVGTGHHNKGAIFALNLFLGWSFLGWVAAFVWACTKPAPRVPIDHCDVLVVRREPRI
jgi:hypothetical protein